jgi:vacuolar iron transporter family protein
LETELRQKLVREHTKEAIRERLNEGTRENYLADAVLGAIDGIITTFAVVSGATGGQLTSGVVIILGLSSLLADGFSMGVSNYLGRKSERQRVDKAYQDEHRQIEVYPEGEREEIRQIYALKGFEGPLLEQIVDVITEDRERWVHTMLQQERGLQVEGHQPVRAGVATFSTFLVAGMIPIVPFLILRSNGQDMFLISSVMTGITFFIVGAVKGKVLRRSMLRSGLEVLAMGGTAAALAYGVGAWLRAVYGM